MTRAFAIFTRLTLVVAPLFPVMGASGQPASAPPKHELMSIWRARRILATMTALHDPNRYRPSYFAVSGSTFRFTADTLEFDYVSVKAGARHSKVDLRSLEPLSAKCSSKIHGRVYSCEVKTVEGKKLQDNIPSQLFLSLVWGQALEYCMGATPECVAEDNRRASLLVDALGRLRDFANDANAPLRTFPQQAAAWRALSSKPPARVNRFETLSS